MPTSLFTSNQTVKIMAIQTSTLRPGLLVSLKTSIVGNVRYVTRDIEPDHITDDGKRQAKWETERTVADPAEHEAAVKVRSKVRGLITGVCSASAFGLLCPESSSEELDQAIVAARQVAEDFNSTATLSRVSIYVITGRIAPDDVEAVRAINSEVSDLLNDMETGVRNLDVKVIRDAANRAKNIGTMLSPDAAARIQMAIDVARVAARKIVQAGEEAAQEIDRRTLRTIREARTAFLDIGETAKISTPVASSRAIDLLPSSSSIKAAPARGASIERE